MFSIEALQQEIERAAAKLKIGSRPATLYEPAHYMLSLGGKRIRPTLVLAACEMLGGNRAFAMNTALGFEVFHNFTLLHDDIMDNSPLRRGKPTVHEKWNTSTAILSGDAMFVKSVQLIQSSENKKVMEVFLSNALLVCEGQQLDMDFESREDVSIDEYIEMITLKTAVLPGACLQAGALLAGADDETARLFFEAGKNIGIAFQLKDDWLDAYGNDEFGKQTGGDILAGKKTYLYLRSLQLLEKNKAEKLKRFYSVNTTGIPKVDAVKRLFDSVNIQAEITKVMREYYRLSLDYIDKIKVSAENRLLLMAFFEGLMLRTK